MYFQRRLSEREINASVIKMHTGKAHEILGHCNKKATREASRALGWVLIGIDDVPCLHCTAAKAKQKNVNRGGNTKARESNGRVGIDISTIKAPKKSEIRVSKPNWLMWIDERSGTKISSFHEYKSDIVEHLAAKFVKFKRAGIPVIKVRCDNAGENKAFEKETNGRK